MTRKTHYLGLLGTAAIVAILNFCVYLVHPGLAVHLNFLLLCIISYTLFCTGVYELGCLIARQKRPELLVQYSLAIIVFKMMFSLGIVFLYYMLKSPDEISYLFPFFISYVAYTIFESIYLVRVDKGLQNQLES